METERQEFGRYVLDLRRGCLLLDGREVTLSPKTFAVLTHLAARPGQLISKEELLAVLGPHLDVTDDTLDQSIDELRRAFGENGPRMIATVPRHGYRFDATAAPPDRRKSGIWHTLRWRWKYGILAPFAVMLTFIVLWFGMRGCSAVTQAAADARPAIAVPGDWKPLLDANFSQFDVYLSYRGDQIMSVLQGKAPADLTPVGLNPKGQTVFTMIEQDGKPVLRISGEIYGCATTKQAFSNYHFRASFKWGDKKWEPRLTELKDSGILYHSRGAFGVDYWKSWALSQEFQVIEHGIGEYWRIGTSEIDIRADPKAPGALAPKWNPKAPWMEFSGANNNALAGSDEDRPGEWNTLELVCFEDRCVHIANGKVVMALKNARYQDDGKIVPMTGGTLQIQSEAAEVFYRDLEIRSIPAMPAEYVQYFKD